MSENKRNDKKTYPKLVLNKLKVVGGPTYSYPIRHLVQGSIQASMCTSTKEAS
jgi:hypothetical protein